MGIGTKALLLSTGLASLGLAGYNLFGPAYANYMDLKRAMQLKQDAENTVKPAIGAALGGLALGGLGSYAAANSLPARAATDCLKLQLRESVSVQSAVSLPVAPGWKAVQVTAT